MKKTGLVTITVAALAFAGGCVVSDQLVTLTIAPDGAAEWVRFQSNIRSTEKGAKGADELKRFVDEFDSRKDADSLRVVAAGGEVLESRWLRREEPYANLVVARLPGAPALESFCTIRDEKGEAVVQGRFVPDGRRRRLSFTIRVPRDSKPAETTQPTFRQLRQEQANGLSETRLVVTGGEIIASRGFVVASDRRSALLDPAEIQDLLQTARERVELFVEWELAEAAAQRGK